MKATFLHTCYRVGDPEASVRFYEKLGFVEERRMPIGDEATNVFLSLPDHSAVLELTHNHGVSDYEIGTGYGHIALAVDDLDAALAALAEDGIQPEKPPYRPGGRTTGSRIAFVRDPDEYRIELVERAAR